MRSSGPSILPIREENRLRGSQARTAGAAKDDAAYWLLRLLPSQGNATAGCDCGLACYAEAAVLAALRRRRATKCRRIACVHRRLRSACA